MNAHADVVVVVHIESVFAGAGQSVLGAHGGGTAPPPEHAVDVCV